MSNDPQVFESVFRSTNRPVWIITASAAGRRNGLVATWVMPASLEPSQPMVMTAIAPIHFTADLIRESQAFALHLLGPQHIEHCWRFGLDSGRGHPCQPGRDKLSGLDTATAATGSPILADCLAWFDCRVVTCYDGGDRLYFWAEPIASQLVASGEPLRENELIAAASPEQKQRLKSNLAADIETLRPLRDAWRTAAEKM